MSFDALSSLHDDVAELAADAKMRHRRAPRLRVEYDLEAGSHTLTVVVDGATVASASGASLESAARKTREAFAAWRDERDLASNLATSLRVARAEKAAGGAR